jgi:hypothetical protein
MRATVRNGIRVDGERAEVRDISGSMVAYGCALTWTSRDSPNQAMTSGRFFLGFVEHIGPVKTNLIKHVFNILVPVRLRLLGTPFVVSGAPVSHGFRSRRILECRGTEK